MQVLVEPCCERELLPHQVHDLRELQREVDEHRLACVIDGPRLRVVLPGQVRQQLLLGTHSFRRRATYTHRRDVSINKFDDVQLVYVFLAARYCQVFACF